MADEDKSAVRMAGNVCAGLARRESSRKSGEAAGYFGHHGRWHYHNERERDCSIPSTKLLKRFFATRLVR